MALTDAQKTWVRYRIQAGGWTKPQINAALQAIDGAMTTQTVPVGAIGKTVPQLLSAAVDNATSPYEFSAADKKRLFALWAFLKFEVDF